jgi:hypothetical protein
MPRIRKLDAAEVASLRSSTTVAAPKANALTHVEPAQMRKAPPERNTKEGSSPPITPAGTDGTEPRPMEQRSPRAAAFPRAAQDPVTAQQQPSSCPDREHDAPQEAVVPLRPVELLLAERRGDIVHLTLGVGITLCGVMCEETPQPRRSYIAAAGCQRCARMAHQLQARCTSCGRPALHLTGAGACVKCGHAHISIRLP